MDLQALRTDYSRDGLRRRDLNPDPTTQFERWFSEAVNAGLREPNAMTLATADARGRPSARIVLMKGMDARGFAFFTNRQSRKGREISENPAAALVFFWAELERQVRVTGRCEVLGAAESESYFKTRPLGSRLAAWVSNQTEAIADRRVLEEKLEVIARQYPDENVPMPSYWGGYLLVPDSFEFWQGRPSRLHDRFLYSRQDDGNWKIERLSP